MGAIASTKWIIYAFICLFISTYGKNLSRYAICLSGELRTFPYTIPRYIKLLDDNKKEGIDVFLYVSNDLGEKLHTETVIDTFLKRPEIKTVNLNGMTSKLPTKVASIMLRCHHNKDSSSKSLLMQGHKIRECQHLIDDYTLNDRGGDEYKLIIRSRPDILLPPQPFYLSKIEQLINDIQKPEKFEEMEKINKHLRNFITMSNLKLNPIDIQLASQFNSHHETINSKHFLLIPMCCDWDGLNDQFAIGNSGAMKAYANRLTTLEPNYPIPSEDLVLVNALSRLNYTTVLRFMFEYTLLRQHNVPHFLKDPDNYREPHKIINAGVSGFNDLVDLDTVCSRDFSKVPNSKELSRQKESSGRARWKTEDLKCKLDKYVVNKTEVSDKKAVTSVASKPSTHVAHGGHPTRLKATPAQRQKQVKIEKPGIGLKTVSPVVLVDKVTKTATKLTVIQ